MIRSALLLSAGLVAALFGCVVPSSEPTVSAAPPPPLLALPLPFVSATCPDGSPFLSHVRFVQNGWHPDPNDPVNPPSAGLGTPLDSNSTYAPNLNNAFLLAPPSFQIRLCNLNGIFVNGPDPCPSFDSCMENSWGYRAQKRPGGNFIAISAGLWNRKCQDGRPYTYHCLESDLLDAQLGWIGPNPPQFSSANPEADNFDMAVLAVLAHEVGHVRWYQVMNPGNPGGSGYNPGKFCNRTFFPTSWQTIHEPRHWRAFKEAGSDSHLISPQISEINAAIQAGQWAVALGLIEQLYRPAQPWPSYFGAISPDEDFVETYKLVVLTSAQPVSGLHEGPLNSLKIVLAGIPHDIPGNLLIKPTSKPLLLKKMACVAPVI